MKKDVSYDVMIDFGSIQHSFMLVTDDYDEFFMECFPHKDSERETTYLCHRGSIDSLIYCVEIDDSIQRQIDDNNGNLESLFLGRDFSLFYNDSSEDEPDNYYLVSQGLFGTGMLEIVFHQQ